MYKILEAGKLAGNIYQMVVEVPRVAKHCLPGQFVIVKADAVGERIPLTICDYDREAGTITIVFMPIGASTEALCATLLPSKEGRKSTFIPTLSVGNT